LRPNAILNRRAILKYYLVALWGVCLYRAITQSITHDEALTYQLYIAAPFSRIFSYFDTNHHFLNTLLIRLSVALFGISEWSVRLPELAGAALYFVAVYQIGVKMFRTAAASLLAVALLTLNPFVLDFMVAARGYGMALALFTYALAELLTYALEKDSEKPRRTLLVRAGIALALSIAAHLIFAVPVFLAAVIALLLFRPARGIPAPTAYASPILKKKRKKKADVGLRKTVPNPVYGWFFAPMVAAGLLFFMLAPLDKANHNSGFLLGGASVAESLRSLASASLEYGGFLRKFHFMHLEIDAVAFFIAPAILIAALALGIRRRNVLLLFTAGTGIGSAVVLFLAHALLNIPYPIDRTGIYFLMLVPLCIPALAESGVATGPLRKTAAALLYGFGLALVLQFASQFTVRSFLTWQYCADVRQIVDRLAQTITKRQPDSVTVGASWQLEPSLNFYLDKEQLTWMRPVERGSLTPGADVYVIMPWDRSTIRSLGLKPVYRWPLSGAILAVPVPPR